MNESWAIQPNSTDIIKNTDESLTTTAIIVIAIFIGAIFMIMMAGGGYFLYKWLMKNRKKNKVLNKSKTTDQTNTKVDENDTQNTKRELHKSNEKVERFRALEPIEIKSVTVGTTLGVFNTNRFNPNASKKGKKVKKGINHKPKPL